MGLLIPSSAFATSGYSYKDSQSSFFSFLFSFTNSKGGSYDWNHDDEKDHWGDKDRDKDWDDDDWKNWDGCLRDKKNSSKCVESKDVWHDWYCGIKGDHDHGNADDDKDDYDWYDKDNEKYSWNDWSFWKWW
jgi:hypothetical protein